MIDKNNFVIGCDFISTLGIRITNVSYCEHLPEGFRSVAEIRFEDNRVNRSIFTDKFDISDQVKILATAKEFLDSSIPVSFK